jgi:CRISPR-associated protein Csx3
MATRYPAIFIGGPPNSGKSWLTYQLHIALKRRGVAHYVLRAHPDGEGHWRYEAPRPVADELRRRATQGWTPAFAERISRDGANRHLPLLVDAGGKVSDEIRRVVSASTGAILIAADPAALASWRALISAQALPLIADLQSVLEGPQRVDEHAATLRGVVSGLGPDRDPAGACFDALVARLDHLCRFDAATLARLHQAMIEIETIDIEAPIGPLPGHHLPDAAWQPAELPALLAQIAPCEALAIYGAGPPWLYAALAARCAPAPVWVFNIARGWVAPPPLTPAVTADPARLTWELLRRPGYLHLRLAIPNAYLDYELAAGTPIPIVEPGSGVVIDGRLPQWLFAALARAYLACAWVGVYEPRKHGAVIVWSNHTDVAVGSLRDLAPDEEQPL